jgi:hypothetical protein
MRRLQGPRCQRRVETSGIAAGASNIHAASRWPAPARECASAAQRERARREQAARRLSRPLAARRAAGRRRSSLQGGLAPAPHAASSLMPARGESPSRQRSRRGGGTRQRAAARVAARAPLGPSRSARERRRRDVRHPILATGHHVAQPHARGRWWRRRPSQAARRAPGGSERCNAPPGAPHRVGSRGSVVAPRAAAIPATSATASVHPSLVRR